MAVGAVAAGVVAAGAVGAGVGATGVAAGTAGAGVAVAAGTGVEMDARVGSGVAVAGGGVAASDGAASDGAVPLPGSAPSAPSTWMVKVRVAKLPSAAFNRAGGADRDALKTGRIALTEIVAWQVWTHDHKWLQKLLSRRIQALGGMRRHGYGRVSGWRLERVPEGAPDMAWVDQGITLRALPIGWLATPVMPTRLPICPPYWHSATVEMAASVGSKSELLNEIIRRVNDPKFTSPQKRGTERGENRQIIPSGWRL